MVNERPKNPDKLNDPEAIVNRYDLRDRKRHTLNSKPTDLNTAQKDSKSTVSADYTTARDLQSPAAKTAKKKLNSESPRTARAQSEGANSRKTDEASESNEFSLSSMFPSIFGSSAPAVLSGPARNTRSASQLSQSFRVPEIPRKPTNPRKDVIKFRSDYANKFAIGSKHTVNFFSGSYEDAQRKARNDVKLLVIFIHDPNDADSIKLIHESLNSSEFDKLVTNNKLIVWGVANDSEEGKYVAYTLHVFKFPFISLMCPRADNRMFSVRRISGFASAAELVERLESSIQITKDDLKELREQK
ncbi:unnamed protein product [Cylicocyclus nassatus]|uniref:UAS domain-containing protein n=1 Tax=Cylicocyclus nassatus TaxID=53992 RepID=A0AA36DP06_CYLNA|nr:unnamed protein product [Cylicocyclus nassatus]